MADVNVTVDVVEAAGLQQRLARLKSSLKLVDPGSQTFSTLAKQTNALANRAKSAMGKPLLDFDFAKSFTDVPGEIKAIGQASSQYIDKQLTGAVKNASKKLEQGKRAFAGWAMSIMFFGMALQRAFSQIWTTSTKTFQDVMHSVEGTVTQFDMLEGSMKYLGFVAGAALEPIAAWLIPVIDSISEWIVNNEELFRTIVAVGGIAGTVFAIGGAAALAVNGFIDLFAKLGIIALDAKGAISTVGGMSMGEFGAFMTNPTVLLVAAAIALIAGLSWKAFKETPEAWKSVKESFLSLKTSVGEVFSSFSKLVEAVFDFKLEWDTIAWTIAWVLKLIMSLINIALIGFEALIDSLTVVVETLGAIGSAADLMWTALLGGGFSADSFSSLIEDLDAVKASFAEFDDVMRRLNEANTAGGKLLVQGPMGLKAESLQRDALAQNAKLENYFVENVNIQLEAGVSPADIINNALGQINSGAVRYS
jgi:hypothetical protein